MTSPSKPPSAEQLVNEALDQANDRMSPKQQQDLARARQAALAAGSESQRQPWLQPAMRFALPAVAVVAVTVLIRHQGVEPVPEMPAALAGAAVPTEDLALLEDLEFVSWLAENESETVL